MELNLNYLILPLTYGGFGPDRHWLGLEPGLEEVPNRSTVNVCESEECAPVETCCQTA